MEIILVQQPIAQTTGNWWQVKVDGIYVGQVQHLPNGNWALREGPDVERRLLKRKKLCVTQWQSREAAACALAAKFYEGEREARSG